MASCDELDRAYHIHFAEFGRDRTKMRKTDAFSRGLGVILAVAALLTTGGLASAQTVVYFPDPGLEASIRDAINKPEGDIYDTDLANMDGNFSPHNLGIEDLTGLEYCINVDFLWLPLFLI